MAEDRRARVRALVLAAAKARTQQALTLSDGPQTVLFAPFSPSPPRVMDAVWAALDARKAQVAVLARHELLVDLGCGDARWLIAGVQRYGCEALGVEIDSVLVERARCDVAQCALSDRIQIELGDVMAADIARAKLVIVYAFAEALHGIRAHLETQLDASAAVLSIGVSAWMDLLAQARLYGSDEPRIVYVAVPHPRVATIVFGPRGWPALVLLRAARVPKRVSETHTPLRLPLYHVGHHPPFSSLQ